MTIYNGVLNNTTKAPEVLDELKNQRLYLRIKIKITLVMEHVFIIYMYINATANNVMLQLHLWHDFYNIVFLIKHKPYST